MLKSISILFLFMITTRVAVFGQTDEEKQVLKTVEDLRLAMVNSDRAALETIASDQLDYWHSSGKHEDKATFVDNLTNGNSDFVTIDLSDQTIKISEDVATVHHILSGKTNDKGIPGEVKIGILLVFHKENGAWKLFARQAFKLA